MGIHKPYLKIAICSISNISSWRRGSVVECATVNKIIRVQIPPGLFFFLLYRLYSMCKECLRYIFWIISIFFVIFSMPKAYTDGQLKAAVSAVRQGRLSISKAAREYNVPKTTVGDHARERHTDTTPGPTKMLSQDEEDGLVNFVKFMASQGFPMTRAMIRCYIQELFKRSGINKSNRRLRPIMVLFNYVTIYIDVIFLWILFNRQYLF